MKELTDEQILEVFQGSDMYRDIEKEFAEESMPEFDEDFVKIVRKCFSIAEGKI